MFFKGPKFCMSVHITGVGIFRCLADFHFFCLGFCSKKLHQRKYFQLFFNPVVF